MHQARHKFLRKDDILHINGILKEWSNLLIAESCYTTTYSCNEEGEVRVFFGETEDQSFVRAMSQQHDTLLRRDMMQ